MPAAEDLSADVAAVAAQVFRIPPSDVGPDLAYGSIAQWDSVGHFDLLVALEQRFGFALTAELIPRLTSVRAIVGFLDARHPE